MRHMSIRTINETIRLARLAKKSRHPSLWTRQAVADRAAGLGAKLYGEAAPEIEAAWLRFRENSSTTLYESDIRKLALIARVLDLDVNALFLSILK